MTPEVQARVVEHIRAGDLLEAFCGKDGIPHRSTVWRHQLENAEFATQCARARELSADVVEARVATVVEGVLSGDIAHDAGRVGINGLTWLAKVRAPKVYGDKVEIDAKVSIGDAVIERLARARSDKEAA
jgi:hypothetical protein